MKLICKFVIILSMFFLWTIDLSAQADYSFSRSGDKYFEEGRYPDAETSYRKALQLNPKASTTYNLANSMFLQDRIPEAIAEYKKAINAAEDADVKQRGYYNMGNAYFQNGEFGQSINAYKEALKINPGDEDAKKNLMLAMRQLKQQQQQQQQEKKEDQQQQQEEQQKQDQEEEQQQQQQQHQQQEQQQQQKEDVSKEEAKEILKAIEREDKRVQEKLKKTSGNTPPPLKDW